MPVPIMLWGLLASTDYVVVVKVASENQVRKFVDLQKCSSDF